MLHDASLVTVTTQETKSQYTQNFPGLSGNICVIPPLWPGRSGDAVRTVPHPQGNTSGAGKRFVYIGRLYPGIRSPEVLLSLFARFLRTDQLQSSELHLYGVAGDCAIDFKPYRHLLDRSIFLHGLVDHDRALSLLHSADILVNLGNITAYQLPSKLIELVCIGKPILNVTPTVSDSSSAFLADCQWSISLNKNSDTAEIARAVEFVMNPPMVDKAHIERLRERHGTVAIAKMYMTAIDRVRFRSG